MKSWTRTLNLDDAHSLLALAEVGMAAAAWTTACHAALPELSLGRRRELIRILRDNFLDWQDGKLTAGLFLTLYQRAPAPAQMQVLELHWALTHPLTLIATETLIGPAIDHNEPNVPLSDVEALVSAHIETSSVESLRKTRTVLLGALEGVGTLVAKGTGANRSLRAQRSEPHPLAFAYLILRDLQARGEPGMMASEALDSSLAPRLTRCTGAHARACIAWNHKAGSLAHEADEITIGSW